MSRNDPTYTTRPLSPKSVNAALNYKEKVDETYKEITGLILRARLGCDLTSFKIIIENETDFNEQDLASLKSHIKIAEELFLSEFNFQDSKDLASFNFYESKLPKTKTGINSYFCFSPYRMSRKMADDNENVYVWDLIDRIFVNAALQNILNDLNERKKANFSFTELPAKESVKNSDKQFSFARDGVLIVDGKIVKSNFRKAPRESRDNFEIEEIDLAAACHLEKLEDGPDVKTAPFPIEGGNVVDSTHLKTLFINKYPIELLEKFFIERPILKESFVRYCIEKEGVFKGRDFEEVKKELVKWARESPAEARAHFINFHKEVNEDQNAEIKKWFEENFEGHRVFFVELDLENITNVAGFHEIYHLDCFFNVVGKYAILPEPGILTPACEAEIIGMFGAENIIRLTKEERISGGANFIVFDDTIILTRGDEHCKSLAAKFNEKGFDVMLPSFPLCANPSVDTHEEAKLPRMFASLKEYEKKDICAMEGLRCGFNRAPNLLLRALRLPPDQIPDTAVNSPNLDEKVRMDSQITGKRIGGSASMA